MNKGTRSRKIFIQQGMCWVLYLLIVIFACGYAEAMHPLITDDTGTQGKGRFQIEVNGEYSRDREEGVTEETFEIGTIASYGLIDPIDIVLGIPFKKWQSEESGIRDSEKGLSDISLEIKWRFYEEGGLSLAVKPGLTFPTGDDKKGLGSGKATYSLFFIATKKIEPWAFHLNLGYIRNENRLDERNDLWHASLANEWEVARNLKLVGNIGMERNPEKGSSTHPAFVIGGIVYSIREDLDIDFGLKGGLTKTEADYSLLAGIAWRF